MGDWRDGGEGRDKSDGLSSSPSSESNSDALDPARGERNAGAIIPGSRPRPPHRSNSEVAIISSTPSSTPSATDVVGGSDEVPPIQEGSSAGTADAVSIDSGELLGARNCVAPLGAQSLWQLEKAEVEDFCELEIIRRESRCFSSIGRLEQ